MNSRESISSSLMLWNDLPTQVSIEETYDLKVWPVTNLHNENPITFNLPPQMKGLLADIHIVTKVKIQKNGEDITSPQRDVSVINNLANSFWGEVSVLCADRTELCQSMKNAYAYQTFFNHALNADSNHKDFLYYNESFLMDSGVSKKSEEDLRTFWKWDKSMDYILDGIAAPEGKTEEEAIEDSKEIIWLGKFNDRVNRIYAVGDTLSARDDKIAYENSLDHRKAWIPTSSNSEASKRSIRFHSGKSVILNSRFQNPLFNTAKCLPTNMKIRISLTKNKDEFLLLCNEDAGYSFVLEDCYLNVTYYKVRDEILSLIEERLLKEPAPYFISKPEIIARPVTHSSRIIRMSDIFSDKLPAYAFFALQRGADFDGRFQSNCYSFVPFGFGEYLRQLYRTIGKDIRGDCLINSTNFHLNFMVGMSFGADRSSLAERHLNLQEKASTYLEIDMGISDVPEDLLLIVYAVFDSQVQIDSNRMLRIIE